MSVQATLVYTDQNGAKQALPLVTGEDTTIGRHPNCSLTISQPSVSRRHARLWFDQGSWFVEDLQSSNGTYVNDKRINRTPLKDGDELRCGDFVLAYGIEERTRAVRTNERRERAPSAPAAPQVSNRATVGLESPPPIPEAPRLSAPQPAIAAPTPAPTPAPAAPAPIAPFGGSAPTQQADFRADIERLEAELSTSKREVESLKEELASLEKQLRGSESELRASRQKVAELNDDLSEADSARSAALAESEKFDEMREKLESELGEKSVQNRTLRAEVEDLKLELDELRETNKALTKQNAEGSASADLEDEISRLKDELEARCSEIEELNRSTQTVGTSENQSQPREGASSSSSIDIEALASQTSELRVALKAASGFVVEVKEVFNLVSALKPGAKPPKSVTELQEIFEENGGLDPVVSLEVAFQRMERTARDLRRLSKSV